MAYFEESIFVQNRGVFVRIWGKVCDRNFGADFLQTYCNPESIKGLKKQLRPQKQHTDAPRFPTNLHTK